ncbi:MAG TPA: 5'-nucleotidase C-terminal domain-containing protein [Bryobacteraceae bacterium]|nr:5'-nucleotidase C-terminal domain-containing protein [Bryobacteraceae bacterium]
MGTLRAFLAAVILAWLASGAELKITLLATTDLHGNLFPYDYYTAQPAARGLAKIATLIQAARAENPNNLLIDCGDTIQGTPLEAVYQEYVETGKGVPPPAHDPMMLAMNAIGYNAMVVGNHEFNFGLKNLARAREDANFPFISSNITAAAASKGLALRPFAPYFIQTVAGVKIAVIGVTTPLIPDWEAEEHYRGYRFESGVDAAGRTVAEVRAREHPDIVIVAAHAGLDGDAKENMVRQIATQVPGIDAIVFGHSHQQLASLQIGDVLLMQPKNWGMSLGEMDFVLTPKETSGWKIVSKTSRLIPVTRDTAADAGILEIGRPYHELAERYLNTAVAQAPVSLDSRLARVEDSALIDAIQQVQLFYSKADVSFASSFNARVSVPKGPVTIRQIAALYVYENQLYVLQGNGKMVRDALENSARYYNTCVADCSQGPLINPQIIGYNYDMAQGVDYEIDLTQPAGQRIRNLRWHGKPLEDSQPLRIAVNNYRAGGSAGYSMFRGAQVIWRSPDEIRDLVIQYYSQHQTLPAQPDNNWRVVPEAARHTLEREALAGAQTVTQQ